MYPRQSHPPSNGREYDESSIGRIRFWEAAGVGPAERPKRVAVPSMRSSSFASTASLAVVSHRAHLAGAVEECTALGPSSSALHRSRKKNASAAAGDVFAAFGIDTSAGAFHPIDAPTPRLDRFRRSGPRRSELRRKTPIGSTPPRLSSRCGYLSSGASRRCGATRRSQGRQRADQST